MRSRIQHLLVITIVGCVGVLTPVRLMADAHKLPHGHVIRPTDLKPAVDVSNDSSNYPAAQAQPQNSQSLNGPVNFCYGACCDSSTGICTDDVLVYNCQSVGGNFTPGLSCVDVVCPPLGACCDVSLGTCTENVTFAECPFPDAEWYQDSACGDIECPPQTGACCDDAVGICTDNQTFGQCFSNSINGFWFPDMTCADFTCPITGACCNSVLEQCMDNVTLNDCFNNGGDLFDFVLTCAELDCPPIGACCDSNSGECTDNTSIPDCFGGLGTDWFFGDICANIPCPVIGACCHPDASCTDNQTLAQCAGGFFNPQISCLLIECPVIPLGACCDPMSGECTTGVPEFQCFPLDWTEGQSCGDIHCPPFGACCAFESKGCVDEAIQAECAGFNDLWFQDRSCEGVSCADNTSCGGLNQSFETGTLTGWIAQDLEIPYVPLGAYGSGVFTFDCFFETQPTDGIFAAMTGWDGQGPGTISLAQDVNVPTSATVLRFDYRAAWLLTFGAAIDRTFSVSVQPTGGGERLSGPEVLLSAPAGGIQGDTGNLTGAFDISPFNGDAVRIVFDWFVPEAFTGPAQFQLDDVRCGAPSLSLSGHHNFATCMSGPASSIPPGGCSQNQFEQSDALTNGHVDLRDFRILSLTFAP